MASNSSPETPGPLLRLSALVGAVGTGLVVTSAVLELGAAHWGLAAHRAARARRERARRALRVSGAARPSRRDARALPRRDRARRSRRLERHGLVDGTARRSGRSRVRGLARHARRGASREADAARLRARLPHADEAADHVAAPPHRSRGHVRRRAGGAAARPLRPHDDRARARLRRGLRAEPPPRPGHRRADGQPDRAAPGRLRPGLAGAGARVRARALGGLVRAARVDREPPDRRSRARRERVLRRRLHALAEALDAAEHRHRRRRRGRSAARRLRGRDGEPGAPRALALPHRVPLDAAALLGARADDQARVRGGGRPDAARRARRQPRRRGRSSSTRSPSSRSRSSSGTGSGRSTRPRQPSSGRSSSCSRCSSAAT